MLFYTAVYNTKYSIRLYYTQIGLGDRPAPPGGRPAPRCQKARQGSFANPRNLALQLTEVAIGVVGHDVILRASPSAASPTTVADKEGKALSREFEVSLKYICVGEVHYGAA